MFPNPTVTFQGVSGCKWRPCAALCTRWAAWPSRGSQNPELCPKWLGKWCRGPPLYPLHAERCSNYWSVISKGQPATISPTWLESSISPAWQKLRQNEASRNHRKWGKLPQTWLSPPPRLPNGLTTQLNFFLILKGLTEINPLPIFMCSLVHNCSSVRSWGTAISHRLCKRNSMICSLIPGRIG